MQGTSLDRSTDTPRRRHPFIARLAPIIVVEIYLNFTLFVFAFGPWEYPVAHPGNVYRYVLAAHAALLLGYVITARRKPRGYLGRTNPDSLLRVAAITTILFIFPTSLLNTGSLIPNVVKGILHPGEAYATYHASRVATVPIAAYARMLVGPLLAMPLPLTVFYWSSLRRSTRWLGAMAIFGNIALYVAMGVNQGVALPIILVPCMLGAAVAARRWRPTKRQVLLAFTSVVLAGAVGLSFFTAAMTQREGSGAVTGNFVLLGTSANRDNFMTRHLSDEGTIAVFGLTSYLGQGYYGLSLALDKPFIPMYGLGHSTFLYRQAERITGNERWGMDAYPERLNDEDGWTVAQYFQTIYPWFASDVTFAGALVVVLGIGALFGGTWRDVVRGDNPYAVAAFSQLAIVLLFFPALDAVLQGGEGITTFWGLLLMWTATKQRWTLARRAA